MKIKQTDLKKYLSGIFFGEKVSMKLEDRLILLISLVGSVLSIISLIGNYLLGLDRMLILLSFFISFAFFTFYFIGRFWFLNKILHALVSITSILYLNLAWFYNYGSSGSVFSLFIVLYALFIFIFEKRMLIASSIMLFLNLAFLFMLEYTNPGFVGFYENENIRVIDMYIGIIISLILIMTLSVLIKRYYEKEYQHARESDQLKSAFLANMSHEIRTPLNAIVGFSSILSDNDFNQGQKDEFVKLIESNSDYLLHFIEDIVDLSKLNANSLTFRFSETNLYELFEKIKFSFSNVLEIEQKELAIDFELNAKTTTIRTDPVRLEQVFRSLINNAIKFTPKGKIDFGCQQISSELVFFVKDTGLGIRPENHEEIFGKFVQLPEIDDKLIRGVGIGLNLSKEIVEKLGGHIWVDSEIGEGTTFYFTLGL